MQKITIFLDIDGVLNTSDTAKKQKCLMDFSLVENFNNFLEKHNNIQIVVSSSWRYAMDDLKKELTEGGFRFWHLVVGKTPTYAILTRRGEQIRRYIDDNNIDTFLVIDDDIDDIVTDIHEVFIVKTHLTDGLAESVMRHLENKIALMNVNV